MGICLFSQGTKRSFFIKIHKDVEDSNVYMLWYVVKNHMATSNRAARPLFAWPTDAVMRKYRAMYLSD